jgi:hypothetical protein
MRWLLGLGFALLFSACTDGNAPPDLTSDGGANKSAQPQKR